MKSLEDILAERNSIVEELTERAESLIEDVIEPVPTTDKPRTHTRSEAPYTPASTSQSQEYREQVVCHWPYYHPEPVIAKLIRSTYMGFLEGFAQTIQEDQQSRFRLMVDMTADSLLFDLDLSGHIFGNRGSDRIAPGEALVLMNSSKVLGIVSSSSSQARAFSPVTGQGVPSRPAKSLTICTQAWMLHIQSCHSPLRIELIDDPEEGPSSFRLIIRKESDIRVHVDQRPVSNSQGSTLRTVIVNKTYTINGEYLMTLSHYQIFHPERDQIMIDSPVAHFQLLLHLLGGVPVVPKSTTSILAGSELADIVCTYPLDGDVRIKSRE